MPGVAWDRALFLSHHGLPNYNRNAFQRNSPADFPLHLWIKIITLDQVRVHFPSEQEKYEKDY